jgi:hypothetical protein
MAARLRALERHLAASAAWGIRTGAARVLAVSARDQAAESRESDRSRIFFAGLLFVIVIIDPFELAAAALVIEHHLSNAPNVLTDEGV